MNTDEWIGLAGIGIAIVANTYIQGVNFGDLKRGVKELINRDDRTQIRIDKVEEKLGEHAESISEIRAHLRLDR